MTASEGRAFQLPGSDLVDPVVTAHLAVDPGIVVPRLPPPGVARSAQHGRRRFSTRSDYEAHLRRLQWVTAPEKTWEDAEVVAGVQRDWHMQGQTGCVFAQGLARKLPTEVWPSAVVPQVRGAGARVDAALATAIASPVAQLLSVLFPTVDCSDALVGLLAELAQSSETLLAEPLSEHRDMIVLRLRAVVTGDGVLAWVLAFGPFDFWPPTRRGPGAELLFRVKPKPERIYPRLDQDRRIAHIADTPIAMGDEDADRRWQGTHHAALDILGEPMSTLTSPNVTLSVPKALGGQLRAFRRPERSLPPQ